jgi:CheY-like chemotaxis protein
MAPHTPVTILLIDDEPSFTSGLARLLRHDGHTVDTAANGQLALAHLQAQRYDVVLCDLRMPELDGSDLYAILSRQHAYLRKRVIFLTGDTLGAASTAFLKQCGQPWVYKPCDAATIRNAVQQTLQAAESTGAGAPGAAAPDPGEPLPEEGTLSIVRRGQRYQVRYASNNPYAPEYPPRVCPDEASLCALLHHVGTEAEALQHACAVARQGRVAVLRLLVTPG